LFPVVVPHVVVDSLLFPLRLRCCFDLVVALRFPLFCVSALHLLRWSPFSSRLLRFVVVALLFVFTLVRCSPFVVEFGRYGSCSFRCWLLLVVGSVALRCCCLIVVVSLLLLLICFVVVYVTLVVVDVIVC
jgi:hypothetical protein